MTRPPRMSGHCNFPQTANPEASHERCQKNGHGNNWNPDKEFSPCPCTCHLEEHYECAECGGIIAEAPHWTGEWITDPDEMVYVHVDPETGRAIGEECYS